LENIYEKLLQEEFDPVKAIFANYLETQNKHKKNIYNVDASGLENIQKQWKWYIDHYKYKLPKDVQAK
jgi:uncharacterized protein YvpB